MSTMTVQTLLAFIAAHNCVSPSLAPVMVGIAQHESGLDPTIIHRNPNGTFDVGLAQVNSANFGWLGLTMETALDPCRNIAAGAAVLLARYNGSPPDSVKAQYATGALAQIRKVDSPQTAASTAERTPPPSTSRTSEREAEINDTPADDSNSKTPEGENTDGF